VPSAVPPPQPTHAERLWSWMSSEETRPVYDELLYPAQAVDGLVHAEGTARLRAALAAQPILERRESGEHLRCRVGEAVLTAGAFSALPFHAIVHTVPPFWPRSVARTVSVQRSTWNELRRCAAATTHRFARPLSLPRAATLPFRPQSWPSRRLCSALALTAHRWRPRRVCLPKRLHRRWARALPRPLRAGAASAYAWCTRGGEPGEPCGRCGDSPGGGT